VLVYPHSFSFVGLDSKVFNGVVYARDAGMAVSVLTDRLGASNNISVKMIDSYAFYNPCGRENPRF